MARILKSNQNISACRKSRRFLARALCCIRQSLSQSTQLPPSTLINLLKLWLHATPPGLPESNIFRLILSKRIDSGKIIERLTVLIFIRGASNSDTIDNERQFPRYRSGVGKRCESRDCFIENLGVVIVKELLKIYKRFFTMDSA